MNGLSILDLFLFTVGLIAAFIVSGNNNATSLGVLFATNAARRRNSYIINTVAMFLGASVGSVTMYDSVYSIVQGPQDYVEASVFSVLFSSVFSFYYLNKIGVPSSLSQMLYPSLAVLVLVSHGEILFNWFKFWFTVGSWIISPLVAIVASLLMYKTMKSRIKGERRLSRQMKIYRYLIMTSSAFTSFVVGANAVGIIISAGLTAAPLLLVVLAYSVSASIGIFFSKKAAITVGFRLTKLGYVGASSSIIGSNVVNQVFTLFGIPISITQTILGGIIGLSLRAMTRDVAKQIRQVAKGWLISPLLSIIISLAAYGIVKSVLGI
jgi:PiT family inorganic phosphate transporter